MKSLISDGRRMTWQEHGEGEPVLLLHSGGLSGRQWRKLVELLAPRFRLLVPDFFGYGASDPWPVGETFHFRQELAALELLLGNVSSPVHLVGHSYGAMLALQLLRGAPRRYGRAMLFEPTAFGVLDESEDADAFSNLRSVNLAYTPDANGADEEWLRAFVEWWNGRGAWGALSDDVRQTFRRSGWKVYQEVLALGADRTCRDDYRLIDNEVLLLGGTRTPLAERRVLDHLAAALPNATLQLIDGAGHMAPLTHTARVNDAILSHLGRPYPT